MQRQLSPRKGKKESISIGRSWAQSQCRYDHRAKEASSWVVSSVKSQCPELEVLRVDDAVEEDDYKQETIRPIFKNRWTHR